MKTIKRDYYIDNLRLYVITLVIMLHAAVTYSGIGNWHFIDVQSSDMVSMLISAIFVTFTNSFSMGFLFLIAGFYAAKSYCNKDKAIFIQSRIKRLGFPVLFFMVFVYPLTMFLLYVAGEKEMGSGGFGSYLLNYFVSGEFVNGSGPLWFALALLIFSSAYALLGRKKEVSKRQLPSMVQILLGIILMGLLSFVLRLFIPMGTEILNMPVANFAVHIPMFFFGIKAYQYDWISQIEFKYAKRWLITTLSFGVIIWLVIMGVGGVIENGDAVISGGLYWQSLAFAVWESFLTLGLSIGLLGFFKKYLNGNNRGADKIASHSFGLYVWHMPVLVGISLLMREIDMYIILKIVIVSAITWLVTFILTRLIKRVPILNQISS